VTTDRTLRTAYSYDSQHERALPDVVVHAVTVEQVVSVVKIAAAHGVPVVARGAGSGMTGGAVPEAGGIVLNLERMNRILRIDAEDRLGWVQPGVVTADFQREAARHGLFYPPEPASAAFSTLGGNVAESAGGLGCVKYGLTKDFVAGVEFVTATGELVRTGVYTALQSPFDVGALLTSSEGMLGIITGIALHLIPLPEKRMAILALFGTLSQAAAASNAILASGVIPSVLEFMDKACIETVREYAGVEIPLDAGAALIAEVDGSAAQVEREHTLIRAVLDHHPALDVSSASSETERAALWKLRKSLSPAIAKIAPVKFNEDICVPLSQIPVMCSFVEDLARRHQIRVVTFGHSGDGNIHVNVMTSWERPDEIARVKEALHELFTHAVALGGTLSGEHGIGIAKRAYIGIALDPTTIRFERKIKRAFDPQNILNPGKVFPG
jgi:glycolate oxidase